jgi:DNA-directed RNA polymerase subunit RPC12/RpoP
MTINEFLNRKRKPFLIADWCGTVLFLIGMSWFVFLQANRGWPFALKYGWWTVVPALPAAALTLWLGNRIRCPVCNSRLRGHPVKRKHRAIPSNCAKCGADFRQQMPSKST